MNKSDLLKWYQQESQEWQALLAEIGLTRLDQPGVNGDWSMKDIIAHLSGCEIRLVDRFEAALRGEAEPPLPWPAHLQSDDEINAWIYESNRTRTLQEVLDEAQQRYQHVLALLEALPDDVRIDLIEPAFYFVWVGDQRYLIGEFFRHFHDDHEEDVRAWMARTSAL